MKSQRWILLAVAAGVTLAMMATGRRGHRKSVAQVHDHRTDLHAWENEGGNLAPARGSAVSP